MARTKVSQLPRIDDRSQLTADDLILVNDGNTTKTIPAQILSNRGGTGYTHTGAFAGKPVDNSYVWEAGEGIRYTQTDVDAGRWRTLSLDRTVHLAVDQPYWTDPTPCDRDWET